MPCPMSCAALWMKAMFALPSGAWGVPTQMKHASALARASAVEAVSHVACHHFLEAWFVEGNFAVFEGLDSFFIDINADDVVAVTREACPGNEADIACADNN